MHDAEIGNVQFASDLPVPFVGVGLDSVNISCVPDVVYCAKIGRCIVLCVHKKSICSSRISG